MKLKMITLRDKNYSGGMSLLEILVVVTIFSILGIIITRSMLLTLRGSKKSESLLKIRENLGYASSVIERNIRNSDTISGCPFLDATNVSYLDSFGNTGNFSCEDLAGEGYIASNSARLTNDQIVVTNCSFTCEVVDTITPPTLTIDLAARDAASPGVEGAQVSISTQIQLRTY